MLYRHNTGHSGVMDTYGHPPAPQQGSPEPDGSEELPPTQTPSGFFNSIRYLGWWRSENHLLGGVCSGLVEHFDWDPTLIRGITFTLRGMMIILSFFIPPVMLAYAVAWMLLPSRTDGRIAFEDLLRGDFHISHAGASLLILIGITSHLGFFSLHFSAPGFLLIPAVFASAVGILIVVIYAAFSASRNSPHPPPSFSPLRGTMSPHPNPPAPTPQPSGQAPASSSAARSAQQRPFMPAAPRPMAPTSHPAANRNPVPTPSYLPRVPAKRPRVVSKSWNLAITGLVFVILAITFFFMRLPALDLLGGNQWPTLVREDFVIMSMLIGGGSCLILVGAALAVAAIHDRGSAWLVALSIVGVFLAGPTLMIGSLAYQVRTVPFGDAENGRWIEYHGVAASSIEADWNSDEVATPFLTDRVSLDLTGAPEGLSKEIRIPGAATENLVVKARQDQPVKIVSHALVDTVLLRTFDNGSPAERPVAEDVVSHPNGTALWTSPSWSPEAGITVHVYTTADAITIELSRVETPASQPETSQSGAITPREPSRSSDSSQSTPAR